MSVRLNMTPDDLLDMARQSTGLNSFGDERFLASFRKIVESVNANTSFTEDGRELAIARFQRVLINRLRFQADWDAHPEIHEQEIVAPVFILGMPRTFVTLEKPASLPTIKTSVFPVCIKMRRKLEGELA